MPAHCCCFGCKSRQTKDSGIKFFRIPKERELQERWIAAIRRENWTPTDHTRICSKHFIRGFPSRDPTNPDFVPTIFNFTPGIKRSVRALQEKLDRHRRLVNRRENINRTDAANALIQLSQNIENIVPAIGTQTESIVNRSDDGTQTDLTFPLMQGILYTNRQLKDSVDTITSLNTALKSDLAEAKENNESVNSKLQECQAKLISLETEKNAIEDFQERVLSYEALCKNERKMKFYTGLPNCATFRVVFESTVVLTNRKKTQLKKEDELLLTLIRLRRNLPVADLGYRFGISAPHVTRVFHIWLDALFKSLGGLVMWPESDRMQLPEVFQNEIFRKVRCIIDCTEIFIDRPQVLSARAQTYSNYKRHNTVKFLVGVSPTGAIIFLSKCWGGRASDKVITIESGFLQSLLPNDVVLADRGFTMEEEFAFKGAKLVVPAFTRGKAQLSAQEVEESRMMSRARIHVERVIGRLKDFEILKGPLSILMVNRPANKIETTVDKMVRVISAIVNMNDPLL